MEAATALGDSAKGRELLAFLEDVPPGRRSPYLGAHAHRFRARLEGNEAGYEAAAEAFRELKIPFWLAVTLLEHGEWLVQQDRESEAEPLLTESWETFTRLGATPWLERVTAVAAEQQAHVPG